MADTAAKRDIVEQCWGALNFILAFYEPQTYLDTNAWKQAEASGRAAHKAAREWLDATPQPSPEGAVSVTDAMVSSIVSFIRNDVLPAYEVSPNVSGADIELASAVRTALEAALLPAPQDASPAQVSGEAKPCELSDPSYHDCPNMKEVGGGMEGERYRCAVCGKSYFLDYEEMK